MRELLQGGLFLVNNFPIFAQFHSGDLVLEGTDECDPICEGKWGFGTVYVLASLRLSRSIKFSRISDHPRFFPLAPSP